MPHTPTHRRTRPGGQAAQRAQAAERDRANAGSDTPRLEELFERFLDERLTSAGVRGQDGTPTFNLDTGEGLDPAGGSLVGGLGGLARGAGRFTEGFARRGARALSRGAAPTAPVTAAQGEARFLASRIGRFDPRALGPGSARPTSGPVVGPSGAPIAAGARAGGPRVLTEGTAPRVAQGPVVGSGAARPHGTGASDPLALGSGAARTAADANPFPQVSGIGRFAARGLATRKNLAAAGVVGTTGVAAANELIGPVGAEVTPLGGDLPGVAAPESPLDEFLARFDTDAAGAAGGEAPQAGAPEGDFDLEGLYGAYSPAVNELLGLENDHWDRVIEQGRDYYEDVTARATQAFDAATTDREKAHWQARLLDAERQYQAGLAQVAQQRHIGLTNVRQYGVQLADHEQAQAASAAQQGIENEQAQRQGNFESFQQGLELHGPALSAAAGQAMSEQFSAALGPETVAALGPSALAVQEASNVALAGDTEGAMAVIGAEVQRLRAAATPETDLAAATLNQLLTAALQSSQAVQQGGLAFLMEQSGVAPGG